MNPSESAIIAPGTDEIKVDTAVSVCNVSPIRRSISGNDIGLLDDSNSADAMNEACAICFETLQDGDEITTSNCAKTFHRSCIITWLMLHDTCPYCRNTFKNINDDKNLDAILANDIFDCD